MKYIQSFMLSAGNYGCYALQIVQLAREIKPELKIDDLSALTAGINSGCIEFNEDDYKDEDNFFVKDPASFLGVLTGKSWKVRKMPADYQVKPGEYAIEFWAKNDKNAAIGIGHFDRPTYHTLQSSYTLAMGKCYSKRIFSQRVI